MEQNNLDNTSGNDVLVSRDGELPVLDLSAYGGQEIYRELVMEEADNQGINIDIPFTVKFPNEEYSIIEEAFQHYNICGKIWLDKCTSLGESAFRGCENITEVVLNPNPEKTPNILYSCFDCCNSLEKVHNLNKVKSIGELAFSYSGLSGKLWIDGCESLSDSAFYSCSNITEVVLNPEKTPNIPDSCFKQCFRLTKVHNLNKVKIIGSNAFYESGLTGKIWIDNCESLGNSTFSFCTGMTEIVLSPNPEKTPNIPDGCFCGCFSLTTIHNLNKVKSIGNWAFCFEESYTDSCPLTGKIWIDSCKSLGKGSFNSCKNITEIVLSPNPEKTPNIPEWCFHGCSSLTKVYNLNKVKSIGKLAFHESGLTEKIWIDSCESLSDNAFSNCSITEIVLSPNPEKTPNIPVGCFHSCSSLTKVHNLNKVKSIYDSAFYKTSLTNKIWIDSCESLSNYAFQACSHITEIVLNPNNTPDIPTGCFADNTSLTKVHNLNKVKRIGSQAFSNFWESDKGCPLTGKIWIDSCESIDPAAFNNCRNITEVVLNPNPDKTPNILDECFAGCTSLTKVYNLDKVKRIGYNTFCESGLIDKIWINSCESLGEYAFSDCPNITEIVVNEELYNSILDMKTDYMDEHVILSMT